MGRASDVEVAVVGGGPVGLVTALLLARAGASVVVLEKAAAVETDLRASTFHPPTLDLLDTLGLAETMVEQGLVCPAWQVRLHPDGDRVVFDLGILADDTRHPYRLQCEQWKLSQAALALLRRESTAQVVFDAEVTDLSQDEEGVEIAVDGASPRRIRARYAVGADGARSAVRDKLGLPLEGETYPETTLLATTLFPFEEHLPGLSGVSYCWKEGGNFSLLRVPGRWRVSIYPREDVPIEEQMTEEAIEASLQEIVPRRERYEVLEKRPYRVHKRIVPHYRRGRVALAGDAAHLNSPAGGMGLNGGIHDAFELAAALQDVRAGAPLERLDLYERRRRPVALDQIIAQADANRARMREKDPARRREILAGLQAIAADRDRLHAHLLRTSMITGLRQAATVS
ncbi:MAG TPA: NAD(P)/FAD-dependent oxidoreductase [Hyphomicrobiales bacterium]|nr:NAD(P)/FAD-dependent oxidoreductase [Hyphomicrobiales bacterium]